MPTLFELSSDRRLYPKNADSATNPNYWRYAALGIPYRPFESSGNVGPERLFSRELGYFGNFREWRLTLDVRAFDERMKEIVVMQVRPPAQVLAGRGIVDFVNLGAFKTRGLEYQLRWKPLAGTEFWINQAFQRTSWAANADRPMPPTRATTIAWFQKLPRDFDFGLIHQSLGAMTWNKAEDRLPSRRQLDVRLAKRFRIGNSRAEAALDDYSRAYALTAVLSIRADRLIAAYHAGRFSTVEEDADALIGRGVLPDAVIAFYQARAAIDQAVRAGETAPAPYIEALNILTPLLSDATLPDELLPTAQEYAARAQLAAGDTEDALELIQSAIAAGMTASRIYLRGQIYEERGDTDAAIRDYEWVLTWAQTFPVAFQPDVEDRLADLLEG